MDYFKQRRFSISRIVAILSAIMAVLVLLIGLSNERPVLADEPTVKKTGSRSVLLERLRRRRGDLRLPTDRARSSLLDNLRRKQADLRRPSERRPKPPTTTVTPRPRMTTVTGTLPKITVTEALVIDGKLGDLIRVKLGEVLQGTTPPPSGKSHDFVVDEPFQFIKYDIALRDGSGGDRAPANWLGESATITYAENTPRNYATHKQGGTFFFVPYIKANEPKSNSSGLLYSKVHYTLYEKQADGSVIGKRVTRPLKIRISDGYSNSGANAVTFGRSRLDIYRQQQRLRYLGFPARSGSLLEVDGAGSLNSSTGVVTPNANTQWAIGLFNLTVKMTPGTASYSESDTTSNSRLPAKTFQTSHHVSLAGARKYINAVNAPRWVEFKNTASSAPFGYGVKRTATEGGPNLERWGTSWAHEVLTQAGQSWKAKKAGFSGYAPNMLMAAVSIKAGGQCSHNTHRAGMDIDIDTDATDEYDPNDARKVPFYKVVVLHGEKYVAAKGNKVIVKGPHSYYAVALDDPAIAAGKGLKAADAWDNADILCKIRYLIEDHPGYKIEVVRAHLQSFAGVTTPSGAKTGSILYNDPRTWDIPGVRFARKHGGHFHVNVLPPGSPPTPPAPIQCDNYPPFYAVFDTYGVVPPPDSRGMPNYRSTGRWILKKTGRCCIHFEGAAALQQAKRAGSASSPATPDNLFKDNFFYEWPVLVKSNDGSISGSMLLRFVGMEMTEDKLRPYGTFKPVEPPFILMFGAKAPTYMFKVSNDDGKLVVVDQTQGSETTLGPVKDGSKADGKIRRESFNNAVKFVRAFALALMRAFEN